MQGPEDMVAEMLLVMMRTNQAVQLQAQILTTWTTIASLVLMGGNQGNLMFDLYYSYISVPHRVRTGISC